MADAPAERGQLVVVSVIRITAGGSAVHETLFPGQPHEMISLYTAEGSDLVLTHFCVLGNQPRMKADSKAAGNQLAFKFAGGANLDQTNGLPRGACS